MGRKRRKGGREEATSILSGTTLSLLGEVGQARSEIRADRGAVHVERER